MEDYNIFDPEVNLPLHKLSRKEAKKHYELHISCIQSRIEELKKIANNIPFDFTYNSINLLSKWFVDNIEEDKEIKGELSVKSFSLCNDVGIYLAEFLISKSEKIHWELNTIKPSDISYHRPVIKGFNHSNKNYYIDFDLLLCQSAYRILNKTDESKTIIDIVNFALKHI